jgi:hypothetical protein
MRVLPGNVLSDAFLRSAAFFPLPNYLCLPLVRAKARKTWPAILSLAGIQQTAAKNGFAPSAIYHEERPTASLPISAQKPHKSTLRFYESIRRGWCFPQVMPFLWEFPLQVPDEELNNAAELPCSAASALCPLKAISSALGVARVSRLIGKSDTTAKRPGWQVYFVGTRLPTLARPKNYAKHKKRHSEEWRFAVLRWSLASQLDEGGGCLLRACCRPSDRFPLLRGRFSGGCSCRVLLFLGWPDSPQQPVHHWHPSNCNPWAVLVPLSFQSLVHPDAWEDSAFWNSLG